MVVELKATINLKTVVVASLNSKVEQHASDISTGELDPKVGFETHAK